MKPISAIARKEWKAAFLSPVALIFLAIFLMASLFVFFFLEGFFARNLADVKPFFEHMPLLLVLLCSAFTMRLWSEEARTGTLEVLLTMPLRIRDLVLGKFLAGMALVAVALALTLPVPISIASMGDLDWGPVLGGYLGLLLLSAAYLAIGMLISSLSGSQLVALMLSLVVCGSLVGLGFLPEVLSVGLAADEVLRALGTGSRFASMLRGVLDLGDLAYYASLAALALVINGLVLEARRWGTNIQGQARRSGIALAVVLLAANLVVLNLGLGFTYGLRADLTEWDEYSITPVTADLVRGAREPLLVRGYFSDQTHPLLDPLVPRIRDFLEELQAVGGGSLTTEFLDPTEDEDLEKEAQRDYGISSIPMDFETRHAYSVVNSYFHILVRYGDRHEVLDYRDLIHVERKGPGEIKVRLRNLEYDVARAIQKVVYGFRSLESTCKQLPAKADLKLIASSKNLPVQLSAVPGRVEKVAGEFSKRCGDRFTFSRIDPDDPSSGVSVESLYQDYGLKPMAIGLLDQRAFYLDLVLQVGQRREVINAAGDVNEADLRKGLEASLQRHLPGALKTVGIAAPKPERPPYPGMPPSGPTFELLRRQLSDTYQVREVDLSTGRVSSEIDVLLVLAPKELDELAVFAIDQFLMRGGPTIIAAGAHQFSPTPGGGLQTQVIESGLEAALASWGVTIGDQVVLDEDNASFPVPVERDLGGGVVLRDIEMVPYPPFVRIHDEGLARDNPATRALPKVVFHWASSVACVQPAGEEGEPAGTTAAACQPLLTTSAKAWQPSTFHASPDYERFPDLGFAAPEERSAVHLGVTLRSRFTSHFKGRPAPVAEKEPGPPPGGPDPEPAEKIRAGVLEHSPEQSRLVVLGSSNFVTDLMLSISQEITQDHLANLQFVMNLVDWSVEDEGLLQIRSKERYARTLDELEGSDKIGWELAHFGFVGLAVIAIGLATLGRRGRARKIRLVDGEEGRSDP